MHPIDRYHWNRSTLKRKKLSWLLAIKNRAKKLNIEYDLTLDNLDWPEYCLVFKTPLDYTTNKMNNNKPTVDRLDPNKGYTSDNCRVISLKANRLKNNASLGDLRQLVDYLENYLY